MLLLDILANADNNVQKASEKLQSMGYEKRDTTTPKLPTRGREEQNQMEREKIEAENTPPPLPRLKSNEEKQKSTISFLPVFYFVFFNGLSILKQLKVI